MIWSTSAAATAMYHLLHFSCFGCMRFLFNVQIVPVILFNNSALLSMSWFGTARHDRIYISNCKTLKPSYHLPILNIFIIRRIAPLLPAGS